MGAFGVVVGSPVLDGVAGMRQPTEQRFVQALVSEAPVQALDEAVLHRLARSDVVPYAVLFGPAEHGV